MTNEYAIPPHPKIELEEAVEIAIRFVNDCDYVAIAARRTSAISIYLEICVVRSGTHMVQFAKRGDPSRTPVKNVTVDDQSGVPELFSTL